MHRSLPFFLALFLVSCLDTEKKYSRDSDDEDRREGTRQGDCIDQRDNDNDGFIDCYDSGCIDKDVCDGFEGADTGIDDTDIDESDDEEEQEQEPEEDVEEPNQSPMSIFHINAVFISASNVVVSGDPAEFDNEEGPYGGAFIFYLVDHTDWYGVGDSSNACLILHSLSPSAMSFDPSFIAAGHWGGWRVDAAESFYGTTPKCDDIDSDYTSLLERWSTADFSVGYGPSSESDLDDFYQAIESNPDNGDWELEWQPFVFSQYVEIDGADEMHAINFARVFEIDSVTNQPLEDSDGNLVPIEMADANSLADGYYQSTTWSGFNPDYFLQ